LIPTLQRLYGKNSTLIKIDTIFKLLIEEVLTSFNIYQFFACFVWIFFRDYAIYGVTVFFTTCLSIAWQIRTIRRDQRRINELHVDTVVKTEVGERQHEDGTLAREVQSSELVPGMIVYIEAGQIVPADVVLLEGYCLVDEALITGESSPVSKSPLKSSRTEKVKNAEAQSILHMGTICMSLAASDGTPKVARGVVIHTRFNTMQGRLVRNMIYSNPPLFKFEKDSSLIILYMSILSIVILAIYLKLFLAFDETEGSNFW